MLSVSRDQVCVLRYWNSAGERVILTVEEPEIVPGEAFGLDEEVFVCDGGRETDRDGDRDGDRDADALAETDDVELILKEGLLVTDGDTLIVAESLAAMISMLRNGTNELKPSDSVW